MLTSHILKFCNPYHGGAHGGAPFIEPRSRIQFQKSHFFSYKMLCRSYERPSMYTKNRPAIRPFIFAPLHTPLPDRPSCTCCKNVGFPRNWGISLSFMGHQKVSAPPCAPPCFIVAKFTMRAQTFPIIIFYENPFLVM